MAGKLQFELAPFFHISSSLTILFPGTRLQAHGPRGLGDGVADHEPARLEAGEALSQRGHRPLEEHQCQGEEQETLPVIRKFQRVS